MSNTIQYKKLCDNIIFLEDENEVTETTTVTMAIKNATEKFDHCIKSPCLNDGVCSKTESGFECICLSLYTGIKDLKYNASN
jgi:hypothetical protein